MSDETSAPLTPHELGPQRTLYEEYVQVEDDYVTRWYLDPRPQPVTAPRRSKAPQPAAAREDLLLIDTKRNLGLGLEMALVPVQLPSGEPSEIMVSLEEVRALVELMRFPWKYHAIDPAGPLQEVLDVISNLADLDQEGSEKYVFEGEATGHVYTEVEADSPQEAYKKVSSGDCIWKLDVVYPSASPDVDIYTYFGKGYETYDYGFDAKGCVASRDQLKNSKGLTYDAWLEDAGFLLYDGFLPEEAASALEELPERYHEEAHDSWHAGEDPVTWGAARRAKGIFI